MFGIQQKITRHAKSQEKKSQSEEEKQVSELESDVIHMLELLKQVI